MTMNKRPKEIEEILEYLEGISSAYAIKKIKKYIKKLETIVEEMKAAEERKWDDGK